MGWDKQKEVKLVHCVKQEVCSRDEARRTGKSDLWSSGKWRQTDEQVWQHRNEYYCQFEERWDFAGGEAWHTGNLLHRPMCKGSYKCVNSGVRSDCWEAQSIDWHCFGDCVYRLYRHQHSSSSSSSCD